MASECNESMCVGNTFNPCVDGNWGTPVENSADCATVGGNDIHGCCMGCLYNTWCADLGRCTVSGEICSMTSAVSILFEQPVSAVCYANQCDYDTKTLYICGGDNQWDEIIPNSPRCQDASFATTIGDVVEVIPVVTTTTGTTGTTGTSGSSLPVWAIVGGIGLIGIVGIVMYSRK